eukprot:TRINITY_DN2006_c1_g1_i1.p1 TRINITY_DN2006_c1_g1~~TRINITY_DN2006_c1_g1_i1.p1  ORF type:complete len:490 (+),score=156.64 TRINITY_DN2006_c1_g1_i1:35-1504(+)
MCSKLIPAVPEIKTTVSEAKTTVMTQDHNRDRFIASMLLAGVGDTMGYRCGEWEFCHNGARIHADMMRFTGKKGIDFLRMKGWILSDDTIMLIATADALLHCQKQQSFDQHCQTIAAYYLDCYERDSSGRAFGGQTIQSLQYIKSDGSGWKDVSFSSYAGGCGAAMRSMCIGLRFFSEKEYPNLIKYSIESGRITHHHPTGYLGAVAGALFTSFAIRHVPIIEWGARLLLSLEDCKAYIKEAKRDVDKNLAAFDYFTEKWTAFLKERKILDVLKMDVKERANLRPLIPSEMDDVTKRDEYYSSKYSFSGWHGSSGHDAPLVAYDSLLGSSTWSELCLRAMLHGGDSDSTGVMAGAWWGALYGFASVPTLHHESLEYRDRIIKLGSDLYDLTVNESGPLPTFSSSSSSSFSSLSSSSSNSASSSSSSSSSSSLSSSSSSSSSSSLFSSASSSSSSSVSACKCPSLPSNSNSSFSASSSSSSSSSFSVSSL